MKLIKNFYEGAGCFLHSFKVFKDLKEFKSDFGMSMMQDSEIDY
jgi:hypothetical protein